MQQQPPPHQQPRMVRPNLCHHAHTELHGTSDARRFKTLWHHELLHSSHKLCIIARLCMSPPGAKVAHAPAGPA